MPLLAQLDDEALDALFSRETLKRARSYVAGISRIETHGNMLRAQVQGSATQPYAVAVRVESKEFFGELSIELGTTCTCPVGGRCKHAAALLIAARKPGMLVDRPREEVLAWARGLGERLKKQRSRMNAPSKSASKDVLLYLIVPSAGAPHLRTLKAKRSGNGVSGVGSDWHNHAQALLKPPAFVSDDDLPVLRAYTAVQRHQGGYGWPRLEAGLGAELLAAAIASGRTFVATGQSVSGAALQRGETRYATLTWAESQIGLAPCLVTEPAASLVVPTEPPWFIDLPSGEAGPVDVRGGVAIAEVLKLPPLSPSEVEIVRSALQQAAPELPAPGAAAQTLRELRAPLRPVLALASLYCWHLRAHRDYDETFGCLYDYALARLHYGEASFAPGDNADLARGADGQVWRVVRDAAAEAHALAALAQCGLQLPPKRLVDGPQRLPEGALGLASELAWRRFYNDCVPRLHAAGWQVEAARDFRHRLLLAQDWQVEVAEGAPGWLEVSLGFEVGGRRVALAPLLHRLFQSDARWLDAAGLEAIADDELLVLETVEGDRVGVPAERIKPLAHTLVDLFDAPVERLRLPALDAERLDAALGQAWSGAGRATLDGWLARLRDIRAVQPVQAPAGLGLTLRAYQCEGLAWLQHLRRHELAGILADDMGLGKTAQTLAHLLLEKEAGRLDRPALVVVPTSLLFNWRDEAARWAPGLRLLSLHGPLRSADFARIPEHDVCLTTYPLLWRDREALAAHSYHLLILDEAQTVKNAGSQAAKAVRSLNARHRLCLTGTPLENHLGELWAQFDFLLPGFLGDSREFTRRWRTPIEKQGDVARRELLARRLAPFILRRRKEQVATELPAKTVIVRSVELSGRQRDLYETVRSSLDAKVREEIAARGFARSQIVILDALLKLRQVCCDPRLLKTRAAAAVRERAKLTLLMEMLPELVEEGRRILLFSQFTAMLALIAAELRERSLGYVELTGETVDRETPVRRFQAGEVPVFLISLKAGGVGLNLTAADTVIHYDPWWNPAAEAQATDRAHRIGQDKAVFVYKLVVAGSIEERILGLQEKKAELAAGILADDRSGAVKFGEDDLRELFAPLPD